MNRRPSLRELRRNLPDKVVILPTAPDRQVQQGWNKESRAERQALREAHPWPGEHLSPGQRGALKKAATINSLEQTPELRVVFAILASLDSEIRGKVAMRLAVESLSGSTQAEQALVISQCAYLTVGERVDLDFAFKRLAELSSNGENPR